MMTIKMAKTTIKMKMSKMRKRKRNRTKEQPREATKMGKKMMSDAFICSIKCEGFGSKILRHTIGPCYRYRHIKLESHSYN